MREGQPQIVDVMADSRIQPGEQVLTAGGDEIFPRGLPVGVVDKVVRDPDRDGFIEVLVKPAAHLDRLDEVLVITSTQPRFPPDQSADMATSEQEKGAEVRAATGRGAEEGLGDHGGAAAGADGAQLAADQQPLNDSSNPALPPRVPAPLHPDRFTPGNARLQSGQPGGPERRSGTPTGTQYCACRRQPRQPSPRTRIRIQPTQQRDP